MEKSHTPLGRLSPAVIIAAGRIISGAGRGKGLGIPTINIDLADVPTNLVHGIYACRITLAGRSYKGAMHYGPRPVFKDSEALEVHIIDATVNSVPETADIEIVGFIRDIADFPSPKALVQRIEKDIDEVRAMLSA